MDENAVRDLLESLADQEPPQTSVSIPLARRTGRRRVRIRRVYLPAAAAPVAAAVAVGLIASLSVGVHGGQLPRRVAPQATLIKVPSQFNPLLPYASFGWLPAGYSTRGLANETTQTSTQFGLTTESRHSQLSFTAYPAGECRVTGPMTSEKAWSVDASRMGPKARRAKQHFQHGLTCRDNGDLPLVGTLPAVNGHPAYRTPRPYGELVWEYGRGAWAELTQRPVICVSCLRRHPGMYRPRASAPSPSTLALLHKVASRMRYGVDSPVVYGFTISGLPAAWRAGRPANPANIPTYNVASLTGKAANVGWVAGPAVDPAALLVSVAPGASPNACNFVAGQSQYVTLDGARTVLRTIDLPYKHVQMLCAPGVDGMQVYLSLDLSIPVTKDTPEPGGATVGNLIKVFRHLRLLGPDVANWTSNPRK
jgi:hypothetical protein